MKQLVIAMALLVMAGCSNTQDHPYYLAATDLKCDAVITTGTLPLIDPIQAFSVCEDREDRLYFPNGVLANTSIASGAGLFSAMVQQAEGIGGMLGGF
jgi:hypothetical protein